MLRRTFCVAIVASVAAFGAWGDELSGLSGKYKYAPEQSADISQAIEQAIEKMNFIKRPIARGRLSRTNFPYQQIRIELGASEAEVTYDTQAPIHMPLGGEAIKWKRADGEVFDVSAKLEGGKLIQTYKAADGTRVNSFSKDASGSIHLEVEVSSPQLPRPVKYTLMYRPAAS
ncbi:hypothetical protein ACFPN2_09045 [Steroidobacter flavus]|uniref:Uncharacterized protein n=1 Tax=Steroidobacter flavus TaxID=1842136 RepID=A0ABV8SS55_9GAMM